MKKLFTAVTVITAMTIHFLILSANGCAEFARPQTDLVNIVDDANVVDDANIVDDADTRQQRETPGNSQVAPEPVSQSPLFFSNEAENPASTPERSQPVPPERPAVGAMPEQPEPVPPDQSAVEAAPEITRAEQVMKALAEAYPRQIERAEFRDNDWAVLLRGTWYYYADARLLPENLRTPTTLAKNAASYSPHLFYDYPAELPPWRAPTPEEETRYRNMAADSGGGPRSFHFFDDLWRSHNRDESYERVKTLRFLGLSVMVHYMILEELSLVEEHILAAAKTNPQVRSWINSLIMLEGWIWRDITGTPNRSYHSYGLAVDLLPNSWRDRNMSWQLAARTRPDWWNVPYNNRYPPPDAVIKAFEKFGFIWGGKWDEYDTMHFEYRPEILLLNGMAVEMGR